ncbi:MAG: hypothetical protein WCQ97_10870 [Aminobacterium sp.]
MEGKKLNIKLGREVRDKVSGFRGIIVGEVKYLYGCHQFCILPPAKNNELKEGQWFDEGRIEVVGPGVSISEVRGETPGGPPLKMQIPPKSY